MSDKPPAIQINWGQVVTSLLVGAILGAFALVRLSDTQTVVIAGHSKAIEHLESSSVSDEIFKQHAESNRREFDTISKSLDSLSAKMDRLLLK